MTSKFIDPTDAIIEPEGVDETYVAQIDEMLRSGKVTGWLQVVVLMTADNQVHIYPQGYGIPKDLAAKALEMAYQWEYAPEA